jgi:hypothetical protein
MNQNYVPPKKELPSPRPVSPNSHGYEKTTIALIQKNLSLLKSAAMGDILSEVTFRPTAAVQINIDEQGKLYFPLDSAKPNIMFYFEFMGTIQPNSWKPFKTKLSDPQKTVITNTINQYNEFIKQRNEALISPIKTPKK